MKQIMLYNDIATYLQQTLVELYACSQDQYLYVQTSMVNTNKDVEDQHYGTVLSPHSVVLHIRAAHTPSTSCTLRYKPSSA